MKKKVRFPGGPQIKRLRVQRGWKIDRAAVELGISRPALENLERGRNWPSAQTLLRLASVYEVGVETLLPATQLTRPLGPVA